MASTHPKKTIQYLTRDGAGNDIVKEIEIKLQPPETHDFVCKICGKESHEGVPTKKVVSANFTDWEYVGDYICTDCQPLFSMCFYNYVCDPEGIHPLNVRQLRDVLTAPPQTPFLFVITTSQKKHLFYHAKWNYSAKRFAVNLEQETIYTTPERMRELFDFVECLQTLGNSKKSLSDGMVTYDTYTKLGHKALDKLRRELAESREIQIPLYCGQKREISEESAVWFIISILTV